MSARKRLFTVFHNLPFKPDTGVDGMPVHTNKYIEAWVAHREVMNESFRFDKYSVAGCIVFLGVIPYFIYNSIVKEAMMVEWGRGPEKIGFKRRYLFGPDPDSVPLVDGQPEDTSHLRDFVPK